MRLKYSNKNIFKKIYIRRLASKERLSCFKYFCSYYGWLLVPCSYNDNNNLLSFFSLFRFQGSIHFLALPQVLFNLLSLKI